MSQCGDLEPLLAPYVDGEASSDDRAVVDSHLHKCPPCRDRVTGERTAREVIAARREELKACAPEQLRRRCAAHLATPPTTVAAPVPQGWLTRRTVLPLSMAATILLAVSGVL